MMKRRVKYFDNYVAGPRTTLTTGDKFRVTGGPYYEATDDTGRTVRIRMSDQGPFIFRRYAEQGKTRRWIEAFSGSTYCLLSVGKRYRSTVEPKLVVRPYKIIGRVGVRKSRRGVK